MAIPKSFKNGANVTSTDSKGNTALHYAASNGHLAIVKILIENANSEVEARCQFYHPLWVHFNYKKLERFLAQKFILRIFKTSIFLVNVVR